MKKLSSLIVASLTVMLVATPVYAGSLDDIVNSNSASETQVDASTTVQDEAPAQEQTQAEVPETTQAPAQTTGEDTQITQRPNGSADLITQVQDATDLSATSPGAQKINSGISKAAAFIVQIIAYFITAFLVVRVALDLCYVTIPFSRSILANGYGGTAAAGGMGQPGMGQPGMGMGMGAGMGGMGMGGMGMRGGYGMNRMGMGGMGMGGMQPGMQGSAPGATPAMGRVQWVSNAALNAVASEQVPGPDGRAVSPFKVYVKDMVPTLVLTPILLVLAITGTLTNLGFLLGDLLANAIANIGNMI